MNENKIFGLIITVIVCITMMVGMVIGSQIITTNYTKELIKTSLENGQNPLYVKCSMEVNSTSECKTLITALSLSGQVKDTMSVQKK